MRRSGNRIEVELRNVRRATLLLGIGELDPERPMQVEQGGVVSVYRPEPSVETLMRWAVRDGDPNLLIWGEIEILGDP